MQSRKYIFAFVITALIFGTAVFISNYFNHKKLDEVRAVENRVAIDILSSETQFSLLEETSCKDIGSGFLAQSLNELADKLSYAENQNNFDHTEVEDLKRSYSLLEIKDYLLMKKVTEKCGIRPTFILYFYTTAEECDDCEKEGYVLTALREKYPAVRVYSFDYNLDLDAIRTLQAIYRVRDTLPAMIINSEPYYGFKTLDFLEESVPALRLLKLKSDRARAATSTRVTKP